MVMAMVSMKADMDCTIFFFLAVLMYDGWQSICKGTLLAYMISTVYEKLGLLAVA